MTMFDFQLLTQGEQINILYNEGTYIGKRKHDGLIALLYQVDSFYVEVVYRKYRCFIASIKCSESTMILDPYLEQIDVEYLAGY